MKGWYGTGRSVQCTCLTSLINTIGGECTGRQRTAYHNDANTSDNSRTHALSFVSCTDDIGKVQKLKSLELYEYLNLFQYPWSYLRDAVGDTLILFLSICPTTTLAATGRNASSFSESESSASVRCSSEEVEDGGFFLIGILTSGTTRSSVLKDN